MTAPTIAAMTDPRIEAAAKALHHAEWTDGGFREKQADECWATDPEDHAGYYDQARVILAAADEWDREHGWTRSQS